tara:strand:+ start:113 stop:733 length:621 start_codon:yes stop_codon:yes gene_type:complete
MPAYNRYVVISPEEGIYDDVERIALEYDKFADSVIIKEFGISGNHPHLNIYLEVPENQRTDNTTKSIKKYFARNLKLPSLPIPFCRTEVITKMSGLIKYTSKEFERVVLQNPHNHKIEITVNFNKKYHWETNPTLNTLVLMYCDFCETNELCFYNTRYVLHMMVKSGINVMPALRQIKQFREIVDMIMTEPQHGSQPRLMDFEILN